MKRQDIGEVLFSLRQHNQTLVAIKLYRNGSIHRSGTGALPACNLRITTGESYKDLFNQLIRQIPDKIIATTFVQPESERNEDSLEFVVAFYGGNCTHVKGVEQWELHSGIRIFANEGQYIQHPFEPLVRTIGDKTMRITDELYFDAIIKQVFELNATSLPDVLRIAVSAQEKDNVFLLKNYFSSIVYTDFDIWLAKNLKWKTYFDAYLKPYSLHFSKTNGVCELEKREKEQDTWMAKTVQRNAFHGMSIHEYAIPIAGGDLEEIPIGLMLQILFLLGCLAITLAFLFSM